MTRCKHLLKRRNSFVVAEMINWWRGEMVLSTHTRFHFMFFTRGLVNSAAAEDESIWKNNITSVMNKFLLDIWHKYLLVKVFLILMLHFYAAWETYETISASLLTSTDTTCWSPFLHLWTRDALRCFSRCSLTIWRGYSNLYMPLLLQSNTFVSLSRDCRPTYI